MDISKVNRIVIKVGSSLIVKKDGYLLKEKWLASLIKDVSQLHKDNKEVVIVSSGAVSLGKRHIRTKNRQLKLEEKQAAAACGQIELLRHYKELLGKHEIEAAQILLTLFDFESRRNYLNVRNTLETLLGFGVVPVINENDTVATHELRFGDNDRLAARVAQMIGADLLIILSDVDGLYTENPNISPSAKHIKQVDEITPEFENMAGGALSGIGSGGMITKIDAAKIAVNSGCNMVIASGIGVNPVKKYFNGAKSTLFVAKDTPMNARKNWISGNLTISGDIIIDDGALNALNKGKSLLPAGVVDVLGEFERGDTVFIKDCRNKIVGRGLIAHNSADAKLIMGQRSEEIEHIIGFSGRDELIHRNDMVLEKG
ncbi:glutamate 5-kinase [Rickettsiales bacterium]|nr:glutamate 5-kinase [Rickettsiales bacterium]